jgi:phospholipid/cholesterol/gamma-HCH transport system substrate-binding protein
MKGRTQNVAVGLTVLAAMTVLGGLIVLFAGLPSFLTGGYEVHIILPATGGISSGDYVNMAGLRVGKISRIAFASGDPTQGVLVVARIDHEISIPANVTAVVSQQLLGASYLELVPQSPRKLDESGQPVYLPRKGPPAVIEGTVRSADVLKQLQPAMESFKKVADSISGLIGEQNATCPATAPATAAAATTTSVSTVPASLNGVMVRFSQALDDMHAVLGDRENQQNLKTALASFAKAAQATSDAMAALQQTAQEARGATSQVARSVDQVTTRTSELLGKLVEDAEQISQLTMSINRVVTKIEAGEGSAGRLLNDPALYNEITDATRQLDALLKDFQKLADQWRTGGVKIQLK